MNQFRFIDISENTLDIVTGPTDDLSGLNSAVVDQTTSNLDLPGHCDTGHEISPFELPLNVSDPDGKQTASVVLNHPCGARV